MPAWFGRHLHEVCEGLASGRQQQRLGRQQRDGVLFESRLLQGRCQMIFSTALFATALSSGGSFGNGGGDGERLQFCFYK